MTDKLDYRKQRVNKNRRVNYLYYGQEHIQIMQTLNDDNNYRPSLIPS
jgi:hypothetical protein